MGRSGLTCMLVGCVFGILMGCASSPRPEGRDEGQYSINIPARATATERLAAAELRKYLSKMTGDDLRIARGKPRGRAIVICNQEHLGEFSATGENAADDNIYLVGERDRATLYAVYDFLDAQGCRFLAPQFDHYQGSAEVVPTAVTITPTKNTRGGPQLKFRKLYVEEGHSHDEKSLKQLVEWMPKAGYNTLVIPTDYQGSGRVKWDNWREELTPELQKRDLIIEVGGHGYQNFLNAQMDDGKLFEQHPEWFGQDQKGVRRREKGWVFCTSNSEAVENMTGNFLGYIQERPEIQIFDFWPPDGAKWCECEKCTAMGTPSNRQAILVAQVQEKVKPVRPDLQLEVLAYHTSIFPPEKHTLDPQILLDFCPISQQFDVQIDDPASTRNKEYVDGLTAWRKAFDGDISIYTYYRKYAWDSLPVIIPHYMQKDLQWYASLPVQGVSVYSEPGDWFTYELNHYVLGQLAWDVNADVDALVRKFCEARYGEAAETAQQTLLTLGQITRTYCSVPHVPLKDAEEIGAAKAQAQELVDNVSAAASRAESPRVKRSLEKLEMMCTYALRDLEVQQMRASKGSLEEMRQKATDLHAWASERSDQGVFLIKNHRLNLPRMLTRLGLAEKKKSAAPE